MARLLLCATALAVLTACNPSIGVFGAPGAGEIVSDEATFDLRCGQTVVLGAMTDPAQAFPWTRYNTDPAQPALNVTIGAPHDTSLVASGYEVVGVTVRPSSDTQASSFHAYCSPNGQGTGAGTMNVTFKRSTAP